MRNKAAEKAKTSGAGGCGGGSSVGGGQNSPTSQASASGGNGGGGGVGSPGSMAGQSSAALQMGLHGSDISALQRPSYSINGILGIPQPDANANINKRKRDDSEDNRAELNGGHPDDQEVAKRHRNHAVYANELYNTMAWNQPNQQQPQQNNHEKWQPVKEEPKNNIPLPEILENSSASPHVMVCF